MLRLSLVSRGDRRAGSALAVVLALVGTVALTTPAQAQLVEQRQQRQQQQRQQQDGPALSRNFQPVYQAVADATNTTGDFAAARAQIPALIAAIGSEYDRYFAGNILLQLGAKASDAALQKQGLELMLASGQATPANAGLFRYFLASLAYDAQDYAGSQREAQASIAAGFAGDFAEGYDPWGLIAESYFKQNRHQEGLAFLKTTIAQRSAARQPVPETWLVRSLAVAYEQRLPAEAADWSALLVETVPNETNWVRALQVVSAVNAAEPQVQLDVLRLMALTNSLKERVDFVRYIEAADPRIMSNEVAGVLTAAVQAGAMTETEAYYVDIKTLVDQRTGQDRSDAPTLAAEARAANATARDAQNAGDVFLSLGSYAEAEEMYALGLQKGDADRDRLLTRLGIAQVHQGKYVEAKASFGQVSGERAAVARLWAAYAQTRA